MIDEQLFNNLTQTTQVLPTIDMFYIRDKKIPIFEAETINPAFSGIDNLSSSGTSGNVEPANVFKLSDGRYICILNHRDSNKAVTIRSADFQTEQVCIANANFYFTYSPIFQDGDDFYFQFNDKTKLVKLSNSNNYSAFIEQSINFDFNGYSGFSVSETYFIYGIVKFDNKFIVISTAMDAGNFPNHHNYLVFYETTDFVNFKMINRTVVTHTVLDLYYVQFGDKIQIYWYQSSQGGTLEYDISKNEIFNVEWNALDPLFNSFGKNIFYHNRLFYYDENTDYLYYSYGSYTLYKRKRNQPINTEILLGTAQHLIKWIVKEKVSTGLKFTVMQQSYVYDQGAGTHTYGIGYQTFESKYSFNLEEDVTNIADGITNISISVSEDNPNPMLSASFLAQNSEEIGYYNTINKDYREVLIVPDRKVRARAKYSNGQYSTIFTGRNFPKRFSINKPVQLKAYGNGDMLDDEVKEHTLTADSLENTIKNLLLKNPAIKENMLEFDTTGFTFPQYKYQTSSMEEQIDFVLSHFPNIIFYYDFDGKYKLKVPNVNGQIYNYSSDIILDLEFEENVMYNVVRVKTSGLEKELSEEARDSTKIEFMNGITRVYEITTTAFKDSTSLKSLSTRVLNQVSKGVMTIRITVSNIHNHDLNTIIRLDDVPFDLASNTLNWRIISKSFNLQQKKNTTTFLLESYFG